MKRVDLKYREWIKQQECSNPHCPGNCGDIIPAHQRCLGHGGIALLPPDEDILPLCFFCHDEEHNGSVTFWRQKTKPDTKVFVQDLCDKHLNRYNQGD